MSIKSNELIIMMKVWRLVFFIVGLIFLFFPAQLGSVLTTFGHKMNLKGDINLRPESLWYVLSISYMFLITCLAHGCIRNPDNMYSYIILLISKLISTTGFVILVIQSASIWILCVASDGFVSITLIYGLFIRKKKGVDSYSFRALNLDFKECWFLIMGVKEHKLPEYLSEARRRVKRFETVFKILYLFLSWFVNSLAPLFFLGKLCKTGSLTRNDFEKLLRKAFCNKNPIIRAMGLIVLAPLMETLNKEEIPPRDIHPLKDKQKPSHKNKRTIFDVVVIGSGAGGAPLAWKLSKEGYSVGIVEKGGIVAPDTGPKIIQDHMVSQGFCAAIGGNLLPIFAGSALGGTTPINSGTCLKPKKTALEWWDKILGTNFSKGELDVWINEVNNIMKVQASDKSLVSASNLKFEKGLQSLGYNGAYVLPRSAYGCVGSGRCCFGCPKGAKLSADLAFLPEALKKGAALFSLSEARRIVERDKFVEVEVLIQGESSNLRCKHLVISAGALFTPGLLKINRLGTSWRKAGKYLKVHPASQVMAYFPDPVNGNKGVPQGLGFEHPNLPNVLMEGSFLPKSVIGLSIALSGSARKWWLDNYDRIASFGLFVQDRGHGAVFEHFGYPLIRYKIHDQDTNDLGKGLLFMAKVFFSAGAKRVLLPLYGQENEIRSQQELQKMSPETFKANALAMSGFHPQGTAGMGRVVDSNLDLYGSNKISVCDASVLPDSPGVNPQVTIMALSLRLGNRLSQIN